MPGITFGRTRRQQTCTWSLFARLRPTDLTAVSGEYRGGDCLSQFYLSGMPRVTRSKRSGIEDPTPIAPKRITMEKASGAALRDWTFTLKTPELRERQIPAVIGDCDQLGSWKPSGVRPLTRTAAPDVWSLTVQLPADRTVKFRYCICVISTEPYSVLVQSWETNLKPRVITDDTQDTQKPDLYGQYDGSIKIDQGWLTTGALIQFKFHKNPFSFTTDVRDASIRIKLTPVSFQSYNEAQKPDTNGSEASECISAQVATIDADNYEFVQQEQFGRLYKNRDFLIFNVETSKPDGLVYIVDFYDDESNRHFGSSYVLSSALEGTEGQIRIPITSSTDRTPIGLMRVEYLIVRPLPGDLCDMSVSYTNHWNKYYHGLDVGHRGSGSSFKVAGSASIRENTIASFKKAAESGGDMLEFDVQLSKDLIPVVYHDFNVCVALKQKNQAEYSEMLQLPMKDLTFDQLQNSKVYHVVEGRAKEPRFFDEDRAEHQPFPKLADVLQAIDPHIGFNVEIKCGMELEDGTVDLPTQFDLNVYLDKILEVVLKFGGERRIVFSSFRPEICLMLRQKQNLYPTMFLTQGITKRYPPLRDNRCNTTQSAVHNALNSGLLGVVAQTEELLKDPSQVKNAFDAGLVLFCWGEDNNDVDTIDRLKKLGLHGIIYDKLYQYCTKEVKESVFLMKARKAKKVQASN